MDKQTPFKMPPSTGRKILISDGTGQAGGLMPDEARSNVYKLYRATRCGPDTRIDPDRQLAFYDPGLGSKSAAGEIKIGFLRRLYNGLSSPTGLGIRMQQLVLPLANQRLGNDEENALRPFGPALRDGPT